ncbi:lipase family protein [Streptomyces sp. NPDC051684]|uniref:lipase family protein n=1 Tax=Streptomyces sp. NPDC051684 TaxID=3365670 RepID=UPI0037A7167D
MAATVLVAAVVGAGGAAPATADAHRPQGVARAGALLGQEALPASFRTPATGEALRVRYRSTAQDGSPDTVSGMVYLPKGRAPHGGWPVVAWDHGTVGVADGCAPSATGPDERAHTMFESWLARGYAVVATDYQSLGTDGEHAYLAGRSAAHATADIVRAARHVDRRVGRDWAVYGHSQGGGAALFTAAYAPRYAPELDLRGAAAAAPPTHWSQMLDMGGMNDQAADANPYYAIIVSGMATVSPGVDPADYLRPKGMEILRKARADACLADILKAGEGLKNSDFKYASPRNGAPEMASLLREYAEPPVTLPRAHGSARAAKTPYRDPLLIVQGTADTTVPEVTSRKAAAELRAAGAQVTYTPYKGVDHRSLPVTALNEVNTWLDARLTR